MSDAIAIPADRLDWRPQTARPTRRPRTVSNPIVEPLWEGAHLLAHVDTRGGTEGGPRCLLIDDEGTDLTSLEAEIAAALAEAFRAIDAVIDGYLTDQATRPGTDVSLAPVGRASGNFVMGRRVDPDVSPRTTGHEEPRAVAFVAVDLLRVDGEDLFDVPLLERKRILDSLLAEGERIRISPYTQPPLRSWLQTWRAAGFRGAVLKASNSRYRPGDSTDDWTVALASGQRP